MSTLNDEYQSMAANAICHAAEAVGQRWQATASYYEQPHVIYKPKLYVDGNQWCALLGDDLQSGVCGFGLSPEKAMWDFDANWRKDLK